MIIVCCLMLNGCRSGSANNKPAIEFSDVPLIDEGGTGKMATIKGRVSGAGHGQQIVLFARSGAWYVQPFTDQPFTKIQPDSTWSSSTHLGTEYAALLVEAEYHPPGAIDVLPSKGGAVVAVAIVPGEVRVLVPAFWQTWWFRLSGAFAALAALLAFHHLRLRQLTRQLNARFDERLEERTRIAQDLHDTLLQGFISASMQLYLVTEQMPEDVQAKSRLSHVQQLMGQVIEEGRSTLQGLRSITADSLDLEQAFSRIPLEFASQNEMGKQVEFRVLVKGKPKALRPLIRDEVYRIGREAVINAFRNSLTKSVSVELKYSIRKLCVFVRNDSGSAKFYAVQMGNEDQARLAHLSKCAQRIGARFKVRSLFPSGMEIEISIPTRLAFQNQFPIRLSKWLTRLSQQTGGRRP